MLPFSLKIAWFVLSLTGTFSCWVTLWSFGRVVGTKWASIIFCIGTTFTQGIFCLGIIYRMDPFLMAEPFCLAQHAFMLAGRFINMGVVFALTLATSMAVRKPKTWGDAHRALQWKKIFSLPVVVAPVLGTTFYLTFSFSLASVRPSDGMWCGTTHPEWVRLLGPIGISFLLSIPIFYLSVQSLLRIRKTNLHLLRSRPECPTSLFGTGSITERKNSHKSLRDAVMMPVNLALTISRKSSVVSARFWKGLGRSAVTSGVDGTEVTMNMNEPRIQGRKELQTTRTLTPSLLPASLPLALLKFNDGSPESSPNGSAIEIRNVVIGGGTTKNVLDDHDIALESRERPSLQDGKLDSEHVNSNFSSVSPTSAFVVKSISKSTCKKNQVLSDGENLATDALATTEQTFRISLAEVGDEAEAAMHPSTCPKFCTRRLNLDTIDLVTSEDNRERTDLASVVDTEAALQMVDDTGDDYMDKRLSMYSAARERTTASMIFTLDGLYKKPKQQPACLAPTLWRVILFQFAFVFIQFLALLTTFVDVASGRRTPSPFGSQHVALLLGAWCPVVIFGPLPIVRRNLIPWRPISIL